MLGDLVGYGGAPNEVVDRIRALNPRAIIRGNHDKAACGLEDGSNFNQVARVAAVLDLRDTHGRKPPVSPRPSGGPDDHRRPRRDLPRRAVRRDHYIFDGDDALRALAASSRRVCLFGHTHLPVVFHYENELFDGFVPEGRRRGAARAAAATRYLINAGSVGQPRDGDPRAAFALYRLGRRRRSTLQRVAYPVDAAQRRILSAGLPASLANRLAVGR